MTKARFDYVDLKATKTDEGFLIDSPAVARTGILTYTNQDGSIRRELRLAEDVFNADSLASFIGKPITVDHPKSLVTHKDVSSVIVGTMLSAGRQDGDNVKADIVIHQPDKIGDRRQLSLGYNVDLDETPGEWEGQKYDAIQRNIRVNHLSVVKRARAGAQARLNMDSDEEPLIMEDSKMRKIKLDGIEYDAAPEVVNALEKSRADAAALTDTLKSKDSEVTKLLAERDTLQARVDGMPAEIAKAQKEAQEAIAKRVQLEKVASNFKLDAKDKTDDEIKTAVIKSFNKDFDPAGKSAEYISAAFDIAINFRGDSAMQAQRVAANTHSPRNDTVDYRESYKASLGSNATKKE